jgi:hypothetical protein
MSKLFSLFKLKGVEFKNRIFLLPMYNIQARRECLMIGIWSIYGLGQREEPPWSLWKPLLFRRKVASHLGIAGYGLMIMFNRSSNRVLRRELTLQ